VAFVGVTVGTIVSVALTIIVSDAEGFRVIAVIGIVVVALVTKTVIEFVTVLSGEEQEILADPALIPVTMPFDTFATVESDVDQITV